MSKKSKSTKQIRAIDRIIKFQIDDGIESLTISGKEVLADVSIDRKANVTLFLNADPDKINEIQSLVPFITLDTVAGGPETDKTKTVTLSQDLTQFALEIADNSKELASIIKSKSSIVIDFDGLLQKLLEIADKLAELERKNQEQDERMAAIEENQEIHSVTLKNHGDRITVLESLKPSEGSFVGCAKMFNELTGDTSHHFIVEELPNESIIFLSILFERDSIQHVFTRNWVVYQADYLQTIIANENVNINYNGVDTLTISFDNHVPGFAMVDVVVLKKGGFTDLKAHVETEEPIIQN